MPAIQINCEKSNGFAACTPPFLLVASKQSICQFLNDTFRIAGMARSCTQIDLD